MNEGFVVAVIRTSGDAPSKGARVTELLLARVDASGAQVAQMKLPDAGGLAGGPALAPDAFWRLAEFVGDRPVVTHDGYNWKRFLRQEFASLPKDQVKQFLARTVDVLEWGRQRFPKQRNDPASICKRLKISLSNGLQGLEREAAALCAIAPHLQQGPIVRDPVAAVSAKAPAHAVTVSESRVKQRPLSFRTRLRHAWAILIGART